jgi:hypothetical protein
MQAMAAAIKEGRLSFAFLETWPFEAATARGMQTHAELATQVGLPLDTVRTILLAFGFSPPRPDDAVLERSVRSLR